MKVYNTCELIGSPIEVIGVFKRCIRFNEERIEGLADKEDICNIREYIVTKLENNELSSIIDRVSKLDDKELIRCYFNEMGNSWVIDYEFNDSTYDYECCDSNEDFLLED